MYLKLKNIERTFDVTAPTERSAKGADRNYWVISFGVNEQLNTEEVEAFFKPENTAEMVFVTPYPNGTEYEYTACGYTKKIFSAIKHTADGGCVVELQFSKEAAEDGI